MRVRLADLSVLLESEAEGVQEEWARLFAGWECAAEPEIALTLQQAGRLPPLPELPPVYADDRGIVDVYLEGREYLLHFHDGALVRLYQDRAEGVVLDTALGNGRLEDVTLTSLAPMLRARGYYLLHAFAATHDGEAVLISGSSGSGKTTSGASLLLGGWRYLANDAVLLQQRDGAVFALPTPGYLQVRPPTLFLLPALRHRRGYPHAATASYIFPAASVADGGWGEPGPVRALYFPQIERGLETSEVQPLEKAVALARLVDESVDRWDTGALTVVVLFFRDLPQQTYREWRNALPHDELARWLLADPAAIPALAAALREAAP